MPAILANAKHFLLTTDYPPDKVVWTFEGSFSVPTSPDMAGSFYSFVPHSFTHPPLIVGMFTTDDWATAYEIGSGDFRNDASGGIGFFADCSADATQIKIHCVSWVSPRTFKFRLVGFAQHDGTDYVKNAIPATNTGFIYNTDFNYLKLIQEGVSAVTATSSTNTLTITHNLGYVPVVYVFIENVSTGEIYRSGNEGSQGVTGIQTEASANTTQLNVDYSAFPNTAIRIHYRIYADE